MKTIVNKISYLLVCIFSVGVMVATLSPVATHAQPAATTGGGGGSGCESGFLGFPPWYRGLTTGGCDIVSPTDVGGIGPFIWTIVVNIVEILLMLAGYAAVAFIIYGGFKYMTSTGSPESMVSARKTIMNAVIGLVISVVAIAVIRTVSSGLGID